MGNPEKIDSPEMSGDVSGLISDTVAEMLGDKEFMTTLLKKVQEFVAKFRSNLTEEGLVALKDEAHELHDLCKNAGLYNDVAKEREEHKKWVQKNTENPSHRLALAWNYFDDRLANAGNAILAVGSIITLFPLVDEILQDEF